MERTLSAGQIAGRLLFFAVALAGVSGVRITKLAVPGQVRNGTLDFVTLDCDYTLTETERNGLVVKWFYNKEPTPVYQWIRGQKPQDLGILRGRLNLDYTASEDEWGAHRALSIRNPTTQLSGEWLCRVSTFEGEATENGRMIVYAPEKEMDIKLVSRPTPDSINISCWAYGVYPEPKLSISYGQEKSQGQQADIIKLDEVMVDSTWNDGSYDVRIHKVVKDSELSGIPGIFDCELKIPNTSYIARKKFFYGGPQAAAIGEEDENGNANGCSHGNSGGLFLAFIVAMQILLT